MKLDHLRDFVTAHPQVLTIPLTAAVTWGVLALGL